MSTTASSAAALRHMITDSQGAAKLTHPERLQVKLAVGDAPGFAPLRRSARRHRSRSRMRTLAQMSRCCCISPPGRPRNRKLVAAHARELSRRPPVDHVLAGPAARRDVHQNISSPGWAKHAWSCFFAPWNAGATVLVSTSTRFSATAHDRGPSPRGRHHVVRAADGVAHGRPRTAWRSSTAPARAGERRRTAEPRSDRDGSSTAWGITIRDGYGQTETTALVGNAPGLEVKPGSMGKPLPGYDVVLLDANGRECDEGELALRLTPRPLGLMQGYIDDAARTGLAMASGFYRTGDEARRDADGYVHFVGRGDDVFKSSDYRISPFEIESALLEHRRLWPRRRSSPSPDPVRLCRAEGVHRR